MGEAYLVQSSIADLIDSLVPRSETVTWSLSYSVTSRNPGGSPPIPAFPWKRANVSIVGGTLESQSTMLSSTLLPGSFVILRVPCGWGTYNWNINLNSAGTSLSISRGDGEGNDSYGGTITLSLSATG